MQVKVSKENLAFFEALASDVRMEIMELLAGSEMNIKELAETIGISPPIMTKHIKKLEAAGIILCRQISRNGSSHKLCSLLDVEYRLLLPMKQQEAMDVYEIEMPVGQYTDIQMKPTCGLASKTGIIGALDDPRVAYDPQRSSACLLWLSTGYVEYKFPNYASQDQIVEEIEISAEISSEAPGYSDVWPSDISFELAGVPLFDWTSPGDYGERRGLLTPSWWTPNQYGLLKTIRINHEGTYLDNVLCSKKTLNDIDFDGSISLKLSVKENARNVGGLTLFGKGFGDHDQDIMVKVFCKSKSNKL